jgi:hypothetical protein
MEENQNSNYVQSQLQEEKDNLKGTSDYREYAYGHLIFECNRCSHRETIEKDVKDGISIFLPTTNKHEWVIVCPRCKNKMRFFFLESFKKDETVEPIETPKKTRKKTKKDELKEGNKEEESS